MSTYPEFAARARATHAIADPWLDGAERFRREPIVLTGDRWRAIAAAAADVAAAHDALARLVLRDPELLSPLGLSPWQRGMWLASAPEWHGIARADVFWTDSGPMVCELNSDTPSGAAEAVLGNALGDRPAGTTDPNEAFPARFVALCEAFGATVGARGPLTVGVVYPTEFPEDLSMIAVYRQWLAQRDHRVELGSPFNLGRARDGRATLFGEPCDVVLRHYKTDWWGERLPIFDDEPPLPDREPLAVPLLHLLGAAVDRRTAVLNPFGAVLTQNKRALALLWERLASFAPEMQAAIRRCVPFTARLETVREELWHARADWVLKPDYGNEGGDVVVGAAVGQDEWEATLAHAIATRWVAQRNLAPRPGQDGELENLGVYLLGGAPAGVYARVHHAAVTDAGARTAPVFVAGGAP